MQVYTCTALSLAFTSVSLGWTYTKSYTSPLHGARTKLSNPLNLPLTSAYLADILVQMAYYMLRYLTEFTTENYSAQLTDKMFMN